VQNKTDLNNTERFASGLQYTLYITGHAVPCSVFRALNRNTHRACSGHKWPM